MLGEGLFLGDCVVTLSWWIDLGLTLPAKHWVQAGHIPRELEGISWRDPSFLTPTPWTRPRPRGFPSGGGIAGAKANASRVGVPAFGEAITPASWGTQTVLEDQGSVHMSLPQKRLKLRSVCTFYKLILHESAN